MAPFIARDFYGYLPRLARKYGDIVSLPMVGRQTWTLVSHPDYIRYISTQTDRYASKPDFISKALNESSRFPVPFGFRDGEEWVQVRKPLSPHFTTKGLAKMAGLFESAVSDAIAGWQQRADTGETFDLQHEFNVVTMSVLMRTMFTSRPDQHVLHRTLAAFEDFLAATPWRVLWTKAPSWIPQPMARRERIAADWIAEYLDGMVAERRRSPTPTTDLLNAMLDVQSTVGSQYDEDRLRTDLRFLIIGGYETTAQAMAWTMAFLCVNPAALADVCAEIDAVEKRDGGIGFEALDDLVWLRACFDEAQRLQSAGAFQGRQLLEDDEIGGYRIPKGPVVYSFYGVNRDPRFWREPDRYDPSRWLNEKINSFAFTNFGFGPHRCMGLRMAYIVGLLSLANILQRYRFQTPDGFVPVHAWALSTKVRGGLPVTMHRR